MNILKEHNLKIFSELYDLVAYDYKVNLEKDKDKNYFSFFINNKYYSILSDYNNDNDIILNIIGEDKQKYVTILETLKTSSEIFNYFYNINYKHSPEKIEYVINRQPKYNKYKKYYKKNKK